MYGIFLLLYVIYVNQSLIMTQTCMYISKYACKYVLNLLKIEPYTI